MKKNIHAITVLIIINVLINSGCRDNISNPDESLKNLALYAVIDGNKSGFLIIDYATMAVEDSFYTTPYVPKGIEFSGDYKEWYSIWKSSSSGNKLYAINTVSKGIKRNTSCKGDLLTLSGDKNNIIVFGDRIIQFYNRENFSLLYEDSIGNISKIVSSQTKRLIYCLGNSLDNKRFGVFVYDLNTKKLLRFVPLKDSVQQRSMVASDIKISPNDEYLYISIFTWANGFSGFGSFMVMDISNDNIINDYVSGGMSQLAVSGDGKNVFISDPAGYGIELPPTYKIFYFTNNFYNTFIDWRTFFNTSTFNGSVNSSQEIIMSPDNKSLVTNVVGSLKTEEGKLIQILKIGISKKETISSFSFPTDIHGHITQRIKKMKIGKYFK
ncbi:MAG: hypothetical protein AAB071_07680 [Bacteroidota bacterium]|mgnify:FL=1